MEEQPDMDRYGKPVNNTGAFIREFEHILLSDIDQYAPLILEDGKLLCRRKHKQQLSKYRARFLTSMIREGLKRKNTDFSSSSSTPLMMIHSDSNGCNVRDKRDDAKFPRLAWSMLSPDRGDYCAAIGVPSYETWAYHQIPPKRWTKTFARNEKAYPWSKKIDKAIWRGSTTYEETQYGASDLGDTPRGRLVTISSEHPDLLDAAFHKILQKFESQREQLAHNFTVKKRMHFRKMMKYKAIIDIDGNNWSARFGMLLCSNSVVIKIDPDFVEHFYVSAGGVVEPMVHYVPASLANLTDVTSYVMDPKNEVEMKRIVQTANSWCQKALSKEGMARESLHQIAVYKEALDRYDNNWVSEWKAVRHKFATTIDDLVDCNPRNFKDHFLHPMLRGL